MRWLLVTNFGNPGDEFARIGVERLIYSVDKDATFEYVRRDPPDNCEDIPIHVPREYDVAVVCSMPGFWSHMNEEKKHECCTTHHAFDVYTNGYLSKKPLIMAGFGCYLTYKRYPVDLNIVKRSTVVPVFKRMLDRCTAVYSRTSLARPIFGNSIQCCPCPSIFAGMDLERRRDLKICNFMPGGAHYPGLNQRESEKMDVMAPKLANFLLSEGYTFVAHCQGEKELATILGWDDDNIIAFDRERDQGKAFELLKVYSRAQSYIGNRIHGAIVSRSFGANALCIGYDTRLRAVEDVGGVVCTPKTFRPALFREWLADTAFDMNLDGLFRTQQEIFKCALDKAGLKV